MDKKCRLRNHRNKSFFYFNSRIFMFFLIFVFVAATTVAIKNPSAVYCNERGFNYEKVTYSNGSQKGYCMVEGNRFDAWKFFEGKVGENYSYCVENGYEIDVRSNGGSSYSQDYAVCINSSIESSSDVKESSTSSESRDRGIPQEELMGLDEMLDNDKEESLSDKNKTYNKEQGKKDNGGTVNGGSPNSNTNKEDNQRRLNEDTVFLTGDSGDNTTESAASVKNPNKSVKSDKIVLNDILDNKSKYFGSGIFMIVSIVVLLSLVLLSFFLIKLRVKKQNE